MRIAYLSSFDPFDSMLGAEISTRDLAIEMARRGHEVSIFHAYSEKPGQAEREGVRVHAVTCSHAPFLGGFEANRRMAAAIVHATQSEPLDILDLRGAGLGYAFSQSGDRVGAYFYHAIDVPSIERRALPLPQRWLRAPFYLLLTRYERLAVDRADWIFVDTNAVGKSPQARYPACANRWSALPLAVPTHWNISIDIPYDPLQFLYIGAGVRRDTGLFLKALAHATLAGLNVKGIVLREPRGKFAHMAERLGVRVTFLPPVSEEELRRLYTTSCAFILPSYREDFCRPVVEAAIHGTPSIVSDSPPVREFVGDGRTGVVVEDWQPASWGDALLRLATNPGYRDSLGQQAQALARKEYLMDVIGAKTEGRYRQILAGDI